MISKFFVDRPIFATVLSLLVVLVGALAMYTLPIAQFPPITPPTVRIKAVYPGASAETVSQALAAPIEQQLSGAKDLLYRMLHSEPTSRPTLEEVLTHPFILGGAGQ